MNGINQSQEVNLRNCEYHGIVLPDKDPKNQGRYKIHIPDLHPLRKESEGIWCKNQAHNWRIGPSEDYFYGSYYPLQPGTKVLVKFHQNDFHSGYVDRIVADQVEQTTPKIGCGAINATSDRDDTYVVFKTPKHHNLFAILENTTDGKNGLTKQLMPNSMHLYYDYRRSTLIMNEDGVHWYTKNNFGETIEGHKSVWVNQNDKLYVQGNRDVYTNGTYKKFTKGQVDYSGGLGVANSYITTIDFQSGIHFAVDSPQILINCGVTKPAFQAATNKGEDEIVKQNKLDMKIVAHQGHNDTFYGAPPKATTGGSPPMPKKEGNKALSRLPQGQSDRYGNVGQIQVDGASQAYPPYPSRGGDTHMVNPSAISAAVASPTSNVKGVTVPAVESAKKAASSATSSFKITPSISSITSATQSASSKISSTISSAPSQLRSSVVSGLKSNLNISNSLSAVGGKVNALKAQLNSVPSYNSIGALPQSITSSANSVKNIIGNANSITDLNRQIENRLNSNISSTITNPVTNIVSSATYGVNDIKRMIETQNVANTIGDITGTTGIGYKVASEIRSLTSGNFATGIIGYIPGATAAASLVNLVGNTMGLGGILSDLACNGNPNLSLSLDNPLDKINKALENLKNSLQGILDGFDASQLDEALRKTLGLDALSNILNGLQQMPNCQSIAKSALQQSSALTSKAQAASTSTNKSWKT